VIPKFSHVPNPEGIVCVTSPVPEPHKA
jgi:hypothetical protein